MYMYSYCDVSGHDYTSSKNFPTKVQSIESVGMVACGGSHTLAVSQDGKTIWSFGGGENGMVDFLT